MFLNSLLLWLITRVLWSGATSICDGFIINHNSSSHCSALPRYNKLVILKVFSTLGATFELSEGEFDGWAYFKFKILPLAKGCHPSPTPQFFWTSFKRGGGHFDVQKFWSKFCMILKAFWQHKIDIKRLFKGRNVKILGWICHSFHRFTHYFVKWCRDRRLCAF